MNASHTTDIRFEGALGIYRVFVRNDRAGAHVYERTISSRPSNKEKLAALEAARDLDDYRELTSRCGWVPDDK